MKLLEVRLRLNEIKSSFAQLSSALRDMSVVYGATIFFNLALPTMLSSLVIFGCDKVEIAGTEIISTCYLLQKNLNKSPISDELSYLIKYLEHLAPILTAAGLVQVNRKILPKILSIITTHVIVILQLQKQVSDR
ncbi:hypothetical protein JTB14_001437 [Gonioctena quinquepunctata]|nr:hypothetical protein JTB14_001437 [Gonioctena quinquepunctata]